MSRKWEYGFVHVDSVTGFLLRDICSMEDVMEQATEGTGDHKGTYALADVLRIAGGLGWETVCQFQDTVGLHWLFKRELE
jgi:hypothetical protein